MKKAISTKNAPAPIGPYNQAIKAGNTLYVSGQIPADPKTGKIVEGIEAQAEMVMNNLKGILEEAGMDFSNVVKTSIFLSDMNNFAAINKIYGSFFTEIPPARETVEVAKLPLAVDVEISCIAVE